MTTAEIVRAVLGQHQPYYDDEACSCGWEPKYDDLDDRFLNHQTGAIIHALVFTGSVA